MHSSWKHFGFHVFCGNPISPNDDTAMENLARYIIRASFSQERMKYLDQEGTVVYTAKDRKTNKVFPAMEWLAAMYTHMPNRGEQMVRYYGYYSNVARGKRQKAGSDDSVPCILEPQGNEKAFRKLEIISCVFPARNNFVNLLIPFIGARKSWAKLIQKIYEVDPLVCPKCQGTMRVISAIDDRQVIRAILEHLGLWLVRSRPLPISKSNHSMILSTATQNTPGMNIFSHNAFLKIK